MIASVILAAALAGQPPAAHEPAPAPATVEPASPAAAPVEGQHEAPAS